MFGDGGVGGGGEEVGRGGCRRWGEGEGKDWVRWGLDASLQDGSCFLGGGRDGKEGRRGVLPGWEWDWVV